MPMSLMNVDANVPNEILANQIHQYIKTTLHYNRGEFIPGLQGSLKVKKKKKEKRKSINDNITKDTNHMIILIFVEIFYKTQ